MPNWVKTEVTFNGSEDDLKKIKEFVNGESEFDFGKVVPYPTYWNCPEKYFIDRKDITVDELGTPHCEKCHINILDDVPYLNWYNWQVDMWGTKWNACEPSWSDNIAFFQTAWSFADPVLVELSKKFPEVELVYRYADEDVGQNCGTGTIKNGEVFAEPLDDDQKMALAVNLLCLEDYYEFDGEKWVYVDDE